MSCNMSGGADNVPECTVRGTRIPMWSSSQPYFVESNSGDSRSAAFHIATWRWHLCAFSVNASVVGGMEQSFTDDAPRFPVFERHILTLHSVMELHDSATLPYAVHMNLVACASTYSISAFTSPMQKSGKHPFLATLTTVAWPMPCNDATASAPESPWIARRSAAMSLRDSTVERKYLSLLVPTLVMTWSSGHCC